jgi:serine/threonine protein kinase
VLEGTVFAGRYRVLRPLGAGAMGAVYEVLDVDTDRRRALKVMHAQAGDRTVDGERWKQEARIAGQIDSRFIVDVFDVGVDPKTGARFLVMELLHGEDLSRRLKRLGPLPPAEVGLWLHQAALALDRMHRAGIIHRDLKPGNLFRDERDGDSPRLKILDFGVAIESTSRDAAAIAGTPMYMAPEQFRDGAQIGAATDVFALGMVAFALVTGRAYWTDDWERCREKMRFALVAVRGPTEPACVRAARYAVTLPGEFNAWFAQATAVDPQLRFGSAGAAAHALGRIFGVQLPEVPTAEDVVHSGALRARPDNMVATAGEPSLRLDSTITAAEMIVGAGEPSAERPRSTRTPRPRPPRWKSRWGRRLVTIALVIVVGLVFGSGFRTPRSPLDDPASVLGCPVMDVIGFDEPAGWLGAAAASLFCERARVVLGGTTARTRIPAELLSLPREPTDNFPADPYADPGARLRTLEAARRSASAYIDGKVTRDGEGFGVAIVLRSGERELARTQGHGRALFEAVREAMQPLIDDGLLPTASTLDPAVADFSQARDPAAALALLDLSMAMVNNAGEVAAECDKVDHLGDRVGEMRSSEQFLCAYTRGLPLPDVPASAPGDTSPGGVATRARLQHIAQRGDDRQRIEDISRLFDAERSAWGRSALAATASCLLQASDPQRAADMARRAVQAEPKNPTGESCAPWVQLVTVTQGNSSAASAARAMQAWAPWDGYGWMFDQNDGPTSLAYARRAYVLSPLDTQVASVLVDKLLAQGAREEARGIELSLESGRSPAHRLASESLRVRIDASEAKFRAALDRAQRVMQITPDDVGWVRVQRLDVAWRALELTEILGGAATAKTADLIVAQFLDPEPSPLDGGHFDVPLRIPSICARASAKVIGPCFARFRELRNHLSGGILPGVDNFTDGAERYAHGDFDGAARAWRPLLQHPATFAAVMFDAMAETFEHTGETYQVKRLIAAVPDTSAELNGASLAFVREARWAAGHGEPDKARALAQKVIDAWSVADETVPAVAEMQGLLASLR